MNPDDRRDPEEHACVTAALAGLPEDHPARKAYAEGVGTIELTHLVEDREIVEQLKQAFLAGYRRTLERSGAYFRP